MKMNRLAVAIASAVGIAFSSIAIGGTVVTEVDNDTLRVVEFKGKPPHRRFTVERAADAERFAHYAELRDFGERPSFVSLRGGAPGKSLPRGGRQLRDPQEVSEFARFEERDADETERGARNWRGAPGKGRALND